MNANDIWDDFDFNSFGRKSSDYQQLRHAVDTRSYPTIYALLRSRSEPFEHHQAYELCAAAIEYNLTLRAFLGVLDRCPPLEEFSHYNGSIFAGDRICLGGLAELAAAHDRADILQTLLDRGASVNAYGEGWCSPLEAALLGGSASCTRLLLARDDLDTTITSGLLEAWGCIGMDVGRDFCCRLAADRLLYDGARLERELPLLPGLTVAHAAGEKNWTLVERICREGTVTTKDGKTAVERLLAGNEWIDLDEDDRTTTTETVRVLTVLFDACPPLMRCRRPRFTLLLSALTAEDEDFALFEPLLERLPGREIVIDAELRPHRQVRPNWLAPGGLFDRWEERIGDRFAAALDRRSGLPLGSRNFAQVENFDYAVRRSLGFCRVVGRARKGSVSRLAASVLDVASPALIAELMRSGSFLADEDAAALLDCCNTLENEWQKRAVIAAHTKREVDYEL